MITNEELQISNESYTSKDFLSIYPELLDIIKKISPNWDPSLSNESDPGNVLLKALAFIGDKINYNTDKNALENFLPSATQETSVRNLCEMGGYYPKYYQSAITTVKIRYDGFNLPINDTFVFPAMTTVISDVDSKISYSLMRPCTIYRRKQTEEVPVIQGVFETLKVGESEVIQLNDLDDNNRIYFPESLVAQNGVFIYNKDSYKEGETAADTSEGGSAWKCVDNLNLVSPLDPDGYYVFKFGFDSNLELPYVEFPDNVAELIESGLIIKYVKTSGSNGNISAGVLTKLVTPLTLTTTNQANPVTLDFSLPEEDSSDTNYDANSLFIVNPSATIGGVDPETIDEAYNSFKKTIGTFNTLVTCRDYANAIYNLIDDTTGLPYVSNIQVADRRSDINYGNTILTYSTLGKELKIDTNVSTITPYELCLYPLNPINQVYDYESYLKSFKPLFDTRYIQKEIEKYKTISHEYKTPGDNSIYTIKNYYKLNAKIITTYKVNAFEQAVLKEKIKSALYKEFNARKVDFGYELPYDRILATIKNADPSIKNVSLDEPEVDTRIRFRNSDEEISLSKVTGGVRTYYLKMLAKNILAGRLPLFDYDIDFDYNFGQSKLTDSAVDAPAHAPGPKINNLYSVTTLLNISGGTNLEYNLRENEVIQCIAPNLQTIITYPAYTNFRYTKSVAQDADDYDDPETFDLTASIPGNTEHQMVPGEKLYINYTDSNKDVINVIYESDGITKLVNGLGTKTRYKEVFVKSNFEVPAFVEEGSTRYILKKQVGPLLLGFYTLSTSEQIDERQVVATVLQDSQLNCYWSTNRTNNQLFTSGDIKHITIGDESKTYYETLLGEGEYFAYCDESKTDVVICGSGTVLQYWGDIANFEDWQCTKELVDSLASGGLSVIDNFNWKVKNFSTNWFEVHDMQILTLTEGSSINIPGFTSGLDNSWKTVDKTLQIQYKLTSTSSPEFLPKFSSDAMAWKIRSRLDLNCGPTVMQEIKGVESSTGNASTHSVTFKTHNTTTTTLPTIHKDGSKNTFMSFNKDIQLAGGVDVDLSVAEISATGVDIVYTLSAVVFDYTPVTYNLTTVEGPVTLTRVNGYYAIPVSSLTDKSSGVTIDLPVLNMTSNKTLLMCYVTADASSTHVVKLQAGTSEQTYLKEYKDSSFSHDVTLSPTSGQTSKLSIIEVANTDATLQLYVESSSGDTTSCQLTLGTVTKAALRTVDATTFEYNKSFGLSKAEEEALKSQISALDSGSIFYYNAPLDNASVIDVKDTFSAQCLWDKNNLFNKFTIAEIDFDPTHTSIEVVKSSQI